VAVTNVSPGPAKIVDVYPMARLTMKDADGWYRWIYERTVCEPLGQLVLVSHTLLIYRIYSDGCPESGENMHL
jgi:hypothetical protein